MIAVIGDNADGGNFNAAAEFARQNVSSLREKRSTKSHEGQRNYTCLCISRIVCPKKVFFQDKVSQPVNFALVTLPIEASAQADLKRIASIGRLQLGSDFSPGYYVLQIVATDRLANEKQRIASQWIDFELVK